MFAIDLISSKVPVLSVDDKVRETLALMNEVQTEQLPVVSEGKYLGLAEELKLMEAEENLSLSRLADPFLKPAVYEEAHFFDSLKMMKDFQLDILPVIDEMVRYRGAITKEELLNALSPLNSFSHDGSLLILKMNDSDYMLSEIARAAEGEDVSLLGVHTFKDIHTGMLQVVLKTNRENLDAFITSLQHLGYRVTYRFDKQDEAGSVQQNYEHLMNYINM